MIKGRDHPDYVHEGELPYVIDTADVSVSEDEIAIDFGDELKPLLWILFGAAFGAALFFLGRWSA